MSEIMNQVLVYKVNLTHKQMKNHQVIMGS